MNKSKEHIDNTKQYYDSKNADLFYEHVWGGEDIHIGIYEPNDSIFQASNRTVKRMVEIASAITPKTRILDLGAGYGGSARFLAKEFQSRITCLNLSQVENQKNIDKNKIQGLDKLIDVVAGNYEELPFQDSSFDIVWSSDALLHSNDKRLVLDQIFRVLKDGGSFIFTDPMKTKNCPEHVLQPILDRIHLKELGSFENYQQLARDIGFKVIHIEKLPEHLIGHYSNVLDDLDKKEDSLLELGCDKNYIDNMKKGLKLWINGGTEDHLTWGILKLLKPV